MSSVAAFIEVQSDWDARVSDFLETLVTKSPGTRWRAENRGMTWTRMEPRAADSLVCRHLVARLARFTAGTRTSLGLSESTDCVGISSHLRNDFGRWNR